MNLREQSLEVLIADSSPVQLSRDIVEDLRRRALQSPKRRARICAHQSTDAPVHEMVIALAGGCYIRPHKHTAKSESFHMIDGELDIVLFDDDGQVIRTIPLSPQGTFFYRNDASTFHTVIVRSAVAIFHETTKGPFVPSDTTYAPWAPDETDAAAAQSFAARLARPVS